MSSCRATNAKSYASTIASCSPAPWKQIRAAIMTRAGDKCEKCGRPNGAAHIVSPSGSWCDYSIGDRFDRWFDSCSNPTERPEDDTLSHLTKTVLTISHIDHDPTNNDPSNLRALCQRCHLTHDAKEHASNARRTRAKKVGQLEMEGIG